MSTSKYVLVTAVFFSIRNHRVHVGEGYLFERVPWFPVNAQIDVAVFMSVSMLITSNFFDVIVDTSEIGLHPKCRR